MDHELNEKDNRYASVIFSPEEKLVVDIALFEELGRAATRGNAQLDPNNPTLSLCRTLANPVNRRNYRYAVARDDLILIKGLVSEVPATFPTALQPAREELDKDLGTLIATLGDNISTIAQLEELLSAHEIGVKIAPTPPKGWPN